MAGSSFSYDTIKDIRQKVVQLKNDKNEIKRY
jgi:hypothetical protein